MPTTVRTATTQTLDLRGHSKVMIEMHIMRLFTSKAGRLSLDCLFDDDPCDALRDLERYSCHWNFQRVGEGHWVIRNFAMTWEECFGQLAVAGAMPLYFGPERREHERG